MRFTIFTRYVSSSTCIIHSDFYFVFSSMDVVCLNMSIFRCYMFVYMYVHALTPPACGLSSVLFYSAPDIKIQTV